MVAENSQPS